MLDVNNFDQLRIGLATADSIRMEVYREVDTRAPDYQPMEYYSSDADAAEWLASISGDYIPESAADGAGSTEPEPVIGEAAPTPEAEVIEADFGEESIG